MNPYGATKMMGEIYCDLYTRVYGLTVASLRLYNVYGERMNPDGEYASLIPKFIKQIKNGEQPTIYGTGEQRRDFVHVDDVVDAFVKATGLTGIYNVGSEVNYSVNEIFEIIRKKLGSDIEPVYGNKTIEPTQTLSNSAKLRMVTDWKPTVSLEKGIERLL
jgi:UDP-glucose 4-epimerase